MEIVNQCIQALESKQVILYPTDTIRGLGGDATDEAVIVRIMKIKDRAPNKSLISLMHPSFLSNYADIDMDKLISLYDQQSSPTTFILPNPKNLPAGMIMNNTVAVRIPFGSHYLMQVLEGFGKPIISTSANIAGQSSPVSFDTIEQEIVNAVDFIVPKDYDTGTKQASAIISYDSAQRIR